MAVRSFFFLITLTLCVPFSASLFGAYPYGSQHGYQQVAQYPGMMATAAVHPAAYGASAAVHPSAYGASFNHNARIESSAAGAIGYPHYPPQSYNPVFNPAGAFAGLQNPGFHTQTVPVEPILFARWTTLSGQRMKILLRDVDESRMDPKTKGSFKIFASYGQQETDVTQYFEERSIAHCAEIGQQLVNRSPEWIQWWNNKCNGLSPQTPERKSPPSPSSDTQSALLAAAAEAQAQLDAAKAEIERLKRELSEQARMRPQSDKSASKEVSPDVGIRLPESLLEAQTTQEPAQEKGHSLLNLLRAASSSLATTASERPKPEATPAATPTIPEPTPVAVPVSPVPQKIVVPETKIEPMPAAESTPTNPVVAAKPVQNDVKPTNPETTSGRSKRNKGKVSATPPVSEARAFQPVIPHLTPKQKQKIAAGRRLNLLENYEETESSYGIDPKEEALQTNEEESTSASAASNQAQEGQPAASVTETMKKDTGKKAPKKKNNNDIDEAVKQAANEAEKQLLASLANKNNKRKPFSLPTRQERKSFLKWLTREDTYGSHKNKNVEPLETLVTHCMVAEETHDWQTADKLAAQVDTHSDSDCYDLTDFYLDRGYSLLMRLKEKGAVRGESRKKFIEKFETYRTRLEAAGHKAEANELLIQQVQASLFSNPDSLHACCNQKTPHAHKQCAHTLLCAFEEVTPRMLYEQALCFLNGWGVSVNEDKGDDVLKIASRQGEKRAQVMIGEKGIKHPELIEQWIETGERSFLDGYVLACIQNPGDQFRHFDKHFQRLFEQLCDEANKGENLNNRHMINVLELTYNLMTHIKNKRKQLDIYFNRVDREQSPEGLKRLEAFVQVLDYAASVLPGNLGETDQERIEAMSLAEQNAQKYAEDYAHTIRRQFPSLTPSFFYNQKLVDSLFPSTHATTSLEAKLIADRERTLQGSSVVSLADWIEECLFFQHRVFTSDYGRLPTIGLPTLGRALQRLEELPAHTQKEKQKVIETFFQARQFEEHVSVPNNPDTLKNLQESRENHITYIENLRNDENYKPFEDILNSWEALMYLEGIHPDQNNMSDKEKEHVIKEKAVALIKNTQLPDGISAHSLFTTAQGILVARGYLFPELSPEQRQKKAIELLVASIKPDCFEGTCQETCCYNPYAQHALASILWEKEKKNPEKRYSRVEQLLLDAQLINSRAQGLLVEVLWTKALKFKDAQRFDCALQLWTNLKEKLWCPEEENRLAQGINEETINTALEILKQHEGNKENASLEQKVELSLQIRSFCELSAHVCTSEQRDALLGIIEKALRPDQGSSDLFSNVSRAQAALIEPVLPLLQLAEKQAQSPSLSTLQTQAYRLLYPSPLPADAQSIERILYIFGKLLKPTRENLQLAQKQLHRIPYDLTIEQRQYLELLTSSILQKIAPTEDITKLPLKELLSIYLSSLEKAGSVLTLAKSIAQKRLEQARKNELVEKMKETATIPDIVEFMSLNLDDSYCDRTTVVDTEKLFELVYPGTEPDYRELISTGRYFFKCAFIELEAAILAPSESKFGQVLECVYKSLSNAMKHQPSFESFDSQQFEDYCHATMFFMQGLAIAPCERGISSLQLAQLMVKIKNHNDAINSVESGAHKRIQALVSELRDILMLLLDEECKQSGKHDLRKQAIDLLQKEGLKMSDAADEITHYEGRNVSVLDQRKNTFNKTRGRLDKPFNFNRTIYPWGPKKT